MKKFTIEITDTSVYINGNLHTFDCEMDKENKEDDMNKKAILALANEMDYEPTFLFEEMTDRLNEMLDEEDFNMYEMIKYWLTELYEREIEEVEGAISNNRLCIYSAKNKDEERMFIQNEIDMRDYIKVLKELKKQVEEAK